MKLGIVRGDFANPWEMQNFKGLTTKNDVTIFTSRNTSYQTDTGMSQVRLFSPYELFGHNRITRAIANRVLVDSHCLFGLEDKLKNFDIAHCAETYYAYTQQCIRAKKIGNVKKVVSTVWENIAFNNEGIHGRKKFKINSFKNIDLFLAVTQKSNDALVAEGCDKNKIRILNFGIDLDHFRRHNVKSFKGIHKNHKLKILFVGRLEHEKGIVELIANFKKISLSNNLELVIVGSGSLEEVVIKESRGNPTIKYLGKVQYCDMPKVYSLCDVYCHFAKGSATWTEQYGMVLIEAMACGLPVVSVDSGSIKEVIGNLETSLEKVILDPILRKKMSIFGIKRAKEKFDSKDCTKKLERIYEDVLRGK